MPRIYIKVEGEKWLYKVVLWPPEPHSGTQDNNKYFLKKQSILKPFCHVKEIETWMPKLNPKLNISYSNSLKKVYGCFYVHWQMVH